MSAATPGALEVLAAPLGVTVQDLGRPGLASLGVSPSGAADRASAALANRLAGNPPDAAVLEVILGGLAVRVSTGVIVAVTGADGPVLVDGAPAAPARALRLAPGARLDIGTATAGLRRYLAVAGGITVAPVLGSRSRDTLAGLGPAAVTAGDVLPVGGAAAPGEATTAGTATPGPAGIPAVPPPLGPARLAVWPGPRPADLPSSWWRALLAGPWRVAPASDRVGVRLAGDPLPGAEGAGSGSSEGVVAGAVQVPPSGLPVVFLADHPVTGGYPVLAVLGRGGLDRLAQCRPGEAVRFAPEAAVTGRYR